MNNKLKFEFEKKENTITSEINLSICFPWCDERASCISSVLILVLLEVGWKLTTSTDSVPALG